MDKRYLAGRLTALLASVAVLAGCAGRSPLSTAAASAPSGAPSSSAVPSQVAPPLPSASTAPAFYQAGVDLANQGRWDDAVEAFTKAIELDPTKAHAFINRRGVANVLRGDAEGASADLDRALSLTSDGSLVNKTTRYRCSAGLGCEP
jgi:tetratricopeptide (TPR) repeat protein